MSSLVEFSDEIELQKDELFDDEYMVIYKGLQVGRIVKDTYITKRNKYVHYFRIFNGYAISLSVLNFLKMRNVRKVIIIERADNGKERLLKSELKTWFDKGVTYRFTFPDGTIDPQLVLHVMHMKIEE